MKRSVLAWLLLLLITAGTGCKNTSPNTPARQLDFDAFGKYWYQGLAEVNTYDLEQYRYGEKRPGEAVLIFVTEDFSREKQVKLDAPEQNRDDAQKVLKLNLTKKFVTGVYPYSMMLSGFTPIYDSVPAVKITASCQEWCGQTFTQLNHRDGAYQADLNSYFEKEGNRQEIVKALAEDDLWNLIRLNPEQLPLGEQDMLPGLLDQRFTHEPFRAQKATVSVGPAVAGTGGLEANELRTCTVTYHDYPRTLRIHFAKAFPYEIAGWEEVHKTETGAELVSRSSRKAVKLLDYWNKNKTEFEPLRRELQLESPAQPAPLAARN